MNEKSKFKIDYDEFCYEITAICLLWEVEWLNCYYLEGRVQILGQAAKALVRSCQDILTPALCAGLP